MKLLNKYICGLGFGALMLTATSCVDETEPTKFANQSQVNASSAATEALTYAMPMYFNNVDEDVLNTYNWHAAFGYGSMAIIRDMQTCDRSIGPNYNGHYLWAAADKSMDYDNIRMKYIWSYYYGFVLTANKVLQAIDIKNCNDNQKGYYGTALAFRAMLYLDLARTYEFLPNDAINGKNDKGNDVTNLTVPIVSETTSEDDARNNPRATREEMFKFILSDLDKAEEYIKFSPFNGDQTFPHLDCVYGLKARLYMWVEDYANAAKYARLAIDEAANSGVDLMTEEECLNTKTGFNDISKWMWGTQMTSEDRAVTTGIVNWTSWMTNEQTFGYAGVGATCMIDAKLYSKISDTDFRKLEFVGPNGPVKGQKFCSTSAYKDYGISDFSALVEPYASIKFRPNEGEADDYKKACATAIPVMRVEEMYLIEAEATAHTDAAKGKELLTAFMKTRNPQYSFAGTSTQEVVDECFLQKRIELFGEGQIFFDYKRLNKPVDRTYENNNWPTTAQLKSTTRPAWMNWPISINEVNNNAAVRDYNNPSSTDAYK